MPSRAVYLVVATYALGFFIFWPRTSILTDETLYLRAAWAFGQGHTTTEVIDGNTGEPRRELPSTYPPGTSALQAPFVRLLGVRGGPLVSLLCYCATGLLLARWLRRQGRSPIFALLFLGYLPALVLGRVGMSDVPSALVVCLAQMLLFDSGPRGGLPASRAASFGAGVIAGVSLLFRETNGLLVGPLFIGAVVRREGRSLLLLLGGLLGILLRPLAAFFVFGDPFFVKAHRSWSVTWAFAHLPLYSAALIVLAPLGLAGALAYRGERRVEVVGTALITFGFFLAFDYDAAESGGFKQLVLGPRYFLPLIPLLAIALSEALPRIWRSRWGRGGDRFARSLGVWWAVVVAMAAFAVHPILDRFGLRQREIADALEMSTSPQGVLVIDSVELDKYFGPWNGSRRLVPLEGTKPADLARFVARDGVAFIALLDRNDSAFHRTRAAREDSWRAQASAHCTLNPVHDAIHGSMRLRVFRITDCSG